MVETKSQSQIIINQFRNLSINQQVWMADTVVNYVIIRFEVNKNPGYPQGIKLYIQTTKEAISNVKGIIDNFLSLAKKYGWGHLAFMIDTGAGANNIFRQVEQIQISDMHQQAHGYFGLLGIGNVENKVLPKPLAVSGIQNLANNDREVQNFYDRVHSDMIAKAIEGSIKKNYLKILKLH